jgi:hypothetical protein
LDLYGTAQRVDEARELSKEAVARGLDDPAAMLGDPGIDQLAAMRSQAG